MKKEELIAENAKLKSQLDNEIADSDRFTETAKRNLAKTLGISTQQKSAYGYSEEELPEWSEIYARIGELRTLARQKDQSEQLRYFEEMINRHELQLNDTQNEK